ncbi:MAG: Gfo/Idh/MocA family oxidoreductase [Pirellulales bacterium]|nr:Gfo/Idh/MocA family oxidoreductase [Pirellulales bacterium]
MTELRKVLVVGSGAIGERHIRCFQSTGRAQLSLCEVNPDLGRRVARQYEIDEVYTDLNAALQSRPEAAVIATPAPLHVPMACMLADAGVALLIEKPLSTSFIDIDRLLQIVERNRVVTSVAYVYRAMPMLAAMRQAIVEERFGRPVQLTLVAGQHFPTYRPAYCDTYYKDRATGGGAIQDALTHMLNVGEWLVGPIDRLVADASHQVLHGVDVEDTVHVCARHGDVLASYSMNQYQAPNETTFTVVCEEGTARFELHRQQWSWMTLPDQPWQEESQGEFARDAAFVWQANMFLDAVEGRALPLCTLQEGLQTLRCNLAVLASVEQGTWKNVLS